MTRKAADGASFRLVATKPKIMGIRNKFIKPAGILLLINLIVVFAGYRILKKGQKPSSTTASLSISGKSDSADMYDQYCPDIILKDIEGNSLELKSFAGDVILLKFSRFFRSELAELLFLDHLESNLRASGVHLIFVASLGQFDKKSVSRLCSLNSPIVEDSGVISGRYNAQPNDLVIIDRGFKIRFKYPVFDKALIFSEIVRWTYGENHKMKSVSSDRLYSLFTKAQYIDVKNNSQLRPALLDVKKRQFITIFTSACMTCAINARIRMFQDYINSGSSDGDRVVFLFGKGNTEESIREYIIANKLDDPRIEIGILVAQSASNKYSDYYDFFDMPVDPRTIELQAGNVAFVETERNLDKLRSMLRGR